MAFAVISRRLHFTRPSILRDARIAVVLLVPDIFQIAVPRGLDR